MLTFLEVATDPRFPCPEARTDFVPPRGLTTFGGPSLKGSLPTLKFDLIDGVAPGLVDLVRSVRFWLVSEKLRRVFEREHAEVEWIEIQAHYRSALAPVQYYVANPLRMVRGVDRAASTIELDEAGIAMSVDRLVLDESKFIGMPAAVLYETRHLVVQPHLRAAIEDARCAGCEFIEVEEVAF